MNTIVRMMVTCPAAFAGLAILYAGTDVSNTCSPVSGSSRIRELTSLETEMPDHRVCCRMKVGDNNKPAGKTRHYRDGEECPSPAELRIIQFADDPEFYLLYCDAAGAEITDTYHTSIDEAKALAEFEFRVKPEEWRYS